MQIVHSLTNPSSRRYSSLSSTATGPPQQLTSRPLLSRGFLSSDSVISYQRDVLDTGKGSITVYRCGKDTGPAIITFHDLGLNYLSNFQVGSSKKVWNF